MSDPGENNLAERLNDTLHTFFNTEDSAMVMKWTLQAEVIDSDGAQALWTMSSPEMSMWDRIGFLGYALAYTKDLLRRAWAGGENGD